MNCILLALTGFGNQVLNGLLNTGLFEKLLVITRKEEGPFPYYECENIEDLCMKKGEQCITDIRLNHESVYPMFKKFDPDLILTATFDQIVPDSLVKLARLGGYNIHPALLPHYRGPTPTHWAIINGEKETGITYHRLSAKPDMGPILAREKLMIGDMTDGELRENLAKLAGNTVGDFCRGLLDGSLKDLPQKENEGSYYPKIVSEEGIIILQSHTFYVNNLNRGLAPYPGIGILER